MTTFNWKTWEYMKYKSYYCTCRCWRNSEKEDKYVLVSLFRGEFSGNVNKIEEQGIQIMSKIRILQRKRIYSYSMHEQSEGVRSTPRSVNSRSEARGWRQPHVHTDTPPARQHVEYVNKPYSKQYAICSSCKLTISSLPNADAQLSSDWPTSSRKLTSIATAEALQQKTHGYVIQIRIRSMNTF